MRHTHTIVDADGVVQGEFRKAQAKGSYGQQFRILLESGRRLLMDPRLLVVDHRLFWHCEPQLAFVEWRALNQAALAVDFGVAQSSVSRGLDRLAAVGLLEREPGTKRAARWRLNPDHTHRGGVGAFYVHKRLRKQGGGDPAPQRALPFGGGDLEAE